MGRGLFSKDAASDERKPLLGVSRQMAEASTDDPTQADPTIVVVSSQTQQYLTRATSTSPYLPLHKHAKRSQKKRRLGWTGIGFVIVCAATFVFVLVLFVIFHGRVEHPTRPVPGLPSTGDEQGKRKNPAYLIEAKNGAVASENGACSEMGVGVLKEGGNAVDAAIATTFCIGVTNFFSCVQLVAHPLSSVV